VLKSSIVKKKKRKRKKQRKGVKRGKVNLRKGERKKKGRK
jgi:hypothetical protein